MHAYLASALIAISNQTTRPGRSPAIGVKIQFPSDHSIS